MRRALVTSGGGAKGAFSLGALEVLFENGFRDYDIISGTSTGSLIASLAGLGMIDELKYEYKNSGTEDILLNQNLVTALATRNYIFDTLPLQQTIDRVITDDIAKQIIQSPTITCFTAVALGSGAITVFTTQELPTFDEFQQVVIDTPQLLRDAMLASSCQAVFLKPVKLTVKPVGETVRTDYFTDGGMRDVLPTRVPYLLGCDEIITLSNNPKNIINTNGSSQQNYENIFDLIDRALSLFIQEVRESNYRRIESNEINTLHIAPLVELDPDYPTGLRFDQEHMRSMFEYGVDIAKQALNNKGIVNFIDKIYTY